MNHKNSKNMFADSYLEALWDMTVLCGCLYDKPRGKVPFLMQLPYSICFSIEEY